MGVPTALAGARPSENLGLSSADAQRRLAAVGPNELAVSRPPHWSRRFAANLTHLFAVLLWCGSVLAWLGGMPELALAVVAVIIVNACFAFAQEFRAERAVESLRRILPHRARVRRDGVLVDVVAEEIVPGDVVVLAAGDRVPADGALIDATELYVDQSALTGESLPVLATKEVHAGTHVVSGDGEFEVAATGMRTELGRITALTGGAPRHRSPLELEMDRVTRLVAVLSVSLGVAFFLGAGLIGMSAHDRFLFAIGVIVANVPEGLLPTVTLSLALATQRMAGRNALVRRLSSVETLGDTTVICTDKTGTLTENEMTVRGLWLPAGTARVDGVGYVPQGEVHAERVPPRDLRELARAAALCNNAALDREADWSVVGDPTEGALLTLAMKIGVDPWAENARLPRRREIPFDSERKRMTTVHAAPDGLIAFVKGAPAVVLERCALPDAERARALAAADRLAREPLRVLAVAARRVPSAEGEPDTIERDLQLLGLVGMHDPPRPEVPEAIARCRAAGIRVVMVTGDNAVTARAVADLVGLGAGSQVLDGPELDALDDATLLAALRGPGAIVARVSPDQKLRIAEILHGAGEVVAMTGDGVNDAPALRAADIGIAMGLGGTDVAREAADIVLLDDNFATIATAVEEGRAVYDNIRRFAQYHFSSNVAELMAFLAWGLSLGAIPLPLVVMQVLAIDLGTDLVPAIALGTERAEPGVMVRGPRSRGERLLNRRVLARVYGWIGLIVGFCALAAFMASFLLAGWRPFEALPDEGAVYVQATAMTCAAIVAGQVGAAFAFRTNRLSVLSVGLLSNRLLLAGIAFELLLLAALIYVPALQSAFHTEALGAEHWLLLAVIPVLVVGAEEARKAHVRNRR
jgi:calcium-translocating P-type ATPase